MNLKVIAVIPARYNSSRLPGKLLMDLGGQSIILTTYLAALHTNLFDDVIVATDDARIYDEIKTHHGHVVMTSNKHESGSDRIAEVINNLDVDVILNIQGDEPFIQKGDLVSLIQIFTNDFSKNTHVATLAEEIKSDEEAKNPNNVKVVLNQENDALYFSRAQIPYLRDSKASVTYLKHIGIYAYRKDALLSFTKLPQGKLESIEKLEQLRYLENGYKIKVAIAQNSTIGIDTLEDLEAARAYLKQMEQ